MKLLLLSITILFAVKLSEQSNEEGAVLSLSKKIFVWEVDNKIDSLENLFDEKFVVVSSNGGSQTKEQYIARLRSGSFLHNAIDVEGNTATVVNNTALVVGKGKFTVTVAGSVRSLHLSYTEVFTRSDASKPWKLLGMHASALEN